MKSKKKYSIMILIIVLLQIALPMLTVMLRNSFTLFSYAEDEINTWDISANTTYAVTATFNAETETLTITGTGRMKDWNFPSYVPWAAIRDSIKHVIITSGVTNIGRCAFSDCVNLLDATIANSVANIGDNSFANCQELTSIAIPYGVIDIGDNVFSNCENLASISIANSVTNIGEYTFSCCNSLTSIQIPSSVVSIEYPTFENCNSLTQIVVNGGNLYYSSENGVLFNKNKSELIVYPRGKEDTTYTIPQSVTTIGMEAFENCTRLTDITIPSGVVNIGNTAFSGCTSLTEMEIPDSVTNLGEQAFSECSNLENITISNNIANIRTGTFAGCESLESIEISENVTNIDAWVFERCSSLTEIIVDENNSDYCSEDGVLFNKNMTTLVCYPAGKEDLSYTIPNGVTTIAESAFIICDNLTEIEIPDTITRIEAVAFCQCKGLTNVEIPDSLIFLGDYNFNDCVELVCIIIPNSVVGFGEDILLGCPNLVIYTSNNQVIQYANANNINCVVEQDAPTILGITKDNEICIGEDGTVTLTIEGATDNEGIGLANKPYSFDNGQSWQSENTKTYTENTNEIVIKIKDRLGNVKTCESIDIENIKEHSWNDGEVVIPATCTEDGTTRFTCITCGEIEDRTTYALGHNFSNEYTVDEPATCTENGEESRHCLREGCTEKIDKRDILATGHSDDEGQVTVEATCTGSGVKTYTCTVCQRTRTEEIEALGHDFSEEYTVDEEASCEGTGTKSRHCTRCEEKIDETEIPATGHSDDEGEVTVEATCTGSGVKTYTCTVCQRTRTEEIEALGHDFSEEYTVDEPATCEGTGTKSRHCTRCDAITDETVIPATGHSDDEGQVTVEATCTGNGVKTYICTVCQRTRTEEIEALGHDFSEEYTTDVEPTCKDTGIKSRHCTRCDAITDETVIPKTENHTWKNPQVLVEPTCTETGITRYTCSVCDGVMQETTSALGHRFSSSYTVDTQATCEEAGSKSKHCTRVDCDAKTDITVIPAKGHTYVDGACIDCGKIEPDIKVEAKDDIYNIRTDGVISQIGLQTSIEDFLNNLTITGATKIRVEDEHGHLVENYSEKIGTGMRLVVGNGNEADDLEYTMVVIGDLTGDGEIRNVDILKLSRYIAGLDETITGPYLEAADIYKDGIYGDNKDLLKMARISAKLESF